MTEVTEEMVFPRLLKITKFKSHNNLFSNDLTLLNSCHKG